MIQLNQIVKTFYHSGGAFTALKGIDLTIDEGQFVAIIGKSGSGKSTLLNMITGIDHPTSGEVIAAGQPIHSLRKNQFVQWRGRTIGIVFQFFQLIPTLTLLENVMLPMDFCRMFTSRERVKRAKALLEEVDMLEQANKYPSAVSGGQQQRVAIARALANDPPIIVADEPTGSLDSQTADSVFSLFQKLSAQGKTIVMVTHDQTLASKVHRSIIVADGQIVNQYMVEAFSGLDLDQYSLLQSQLQTIHYPAGSVIIHEGDEADCAYVILSGEVEISVKQPNGQKVIVSILGKGQYFGEIALVQGGRRTATVRCSIHSDVVVAVLQRDTFVGLVKNSEMTKQEIDLMIRQRLGQLSGIRV
ncbi:ATP-binding cassette domain-containing protein [Paenibacillus rigui]|nr:ATP-binding cassette domain-containing protein [Paenibacillus rigui]